MTGDVIRQTDNGTEYETNEFKNFCRGASIKRETTMFVGYSETSKAYRFYVLGQREVEICHDITFDEDNSLRKVVNLLRSEEGHEARPGNQEEPKDEIMPDVEGPMDPIGPPPSLGKRPSWLRDTLEDAEGHMAPKGDIP